MENQTDTVRELITVFSRIKEQTVDADILLPDYYPEIAKILDCSMELSQEDVTLTADKISLSGAARVRLLYTSESGELRCYENAVKYTKLIDGGGFETGDICLIRQRVTDLNFRAVSPRKVEVRASAAIAAEVKRLRETPFLCGCGDPSVQLRTAETPCLRLSAFSAAGFELNERISLPLPKDSVRGVLRTAAAVSWTEIGVINNKVKLSGTAEVTFAVITEENLVSGEHTVSLPFTQVKDLFGAAEHDVCTCHLRSAEAVLDMKEGGDAREGGVTIKVNVLLAAWRSGSCRHVADAFSPEAELALKKTELSLLQEAAETTDVAEFSGELQTYETQVSELSDKTVTDIGYALFEDQDGRRLNGSMTLRLLLRDKENAYRCVSRSCSFAAALPESCSGTEEIAVSLNSFTADFAADGKIKYRGTLRLNVLRLRETAAEAVTAMERGEAFRRPDREQIVLYYGEPGESVWEIAKENRTSVSALKELNGMEEDVLQNKQLLIFKA